MVKQECEAKANSMLDYYADLTGLWESVTGLDRGKGDRYDIANNVETFIKDTNPKTFGDHHGELVKNLKLVEDAVKSNFIKVAMVEMGKVFVGMPKILVDVISECECGPGTEMDEVQLKVPIDQDDQVLKVLGEAGYDVGTDAYYADDKFVTVVVRPGQSTLRKG